MIKLEINDVNELSKLPIISETELKEYLKDTFPQDFKESEKLSYGDISEMLKYLSKIKNIDNVYEIFLDVGADIKVTYGYIIE